jgi:hypothetical protein
MNWVKTNGKTNEEMTAATVLRPRRDSRLSAVAVGPPATADGTGLLGIKSEPFLSPWLLQSVPALKIADSGVDPHRQSVL